MQSPEGVGAVLAAARVRQGLSILDVSERTRVRTALIEQIEGDDFTSCGGSVYARGHIRSIARTLGIDPVPLIAEFDRRHGRLTGPQPLPARPVDPLIPQGAGARRGFPWAPAVIVALVAVCVLAALAVLVPNGSGGALRDPTGVRAAATVPPVTPGAGATGAPAGPVRSATPAPSGVNVEVAVRDEPSWLEMRDEAQRVLLQQLLQPGDSRLVKAARSVEIRIGNAGSVAVFCNGRDLGVGGSPGQVLTVRVGLGASGDCAIGNPASR
ncbi:MULTISPECIES: helix-turn-helix domain-containing protein [unclassified Frankia]|uniref:helix-turn-helix domain-containing protein n=1 Tax=unclassified Frankia TaxID=2632575 RepID=UPI002024EC7A